MERLTITLPTFLRISASTPRGMVSQLKTFTKPGGYDFYKVFKRLAAGIASGAINLAQAEEDIGQIVQKPEREHTLEAINTFNDWYSKQNLIWQAPPRDKFKSNSGLLTVRLEPELAFKSAGSTNTSIIYLWNLKKPELKLDLAAEGLQLLMNNLVGAHYQFGIFDLRKKQIRGAETISVATNARLQNNLRLVEEIWKDIHTPSMSIEDTLSHISSLKLPPPSPPPS